MRKRGLVSGLIQVFRWPRFWGKNVYVHPLSSIGRNVLIGYGTNINGPCFVSREKEIFLKIGKYCAIAHNFRVRLSNHDSDFINLQYDLQERLGLVIPKKKMGDVVIGNNVWIGDNVIVLPGVKIGEGAIIGAGSVVTKDVSPYSVNAGVPCKKIRYRFPKDIIEKILEKRIFDRSEVFLKEKHKELFSLRYSDDPSRFVNLLEDFE
jgi:virginiamycin A acetyltransferase